MVAVSSLAADGVEARSEPDVMTGRSATPLPTDAEGRREFIRQAAQALGLHLTEQQIEDLALQILGGDEPSSGVVSIAVAADPCGGGSDVLSRACRVILDGAKKARASVGECGTALGKLIARRSVGALDGVVRDRGGPAVVATALSRIGFGLNSLCKAIVPNPLGVGDVVCDAAFGG
jgi:hypothetical protein